MFRSIVNEIFILFLSCFLSSYLFAVQFTPEDATVLFQTDEVPARVLCLGAGFKNGHLITTYSCALDLRSSQNLGIQVTASSLSGKQYGGIKPIADLGSDRLVSLFLITPVDFETKLVGNFLESPSECSLYIVDAVKKIQCMNCTENYCQTNAYDEMRGSPIYYKKNLLCIYSGYSGFCDQPHDQRLALRKEGLGFSTPTRRKLLETTERDASSDNFTCICDCQAEGDSTGLQIWHRFTESAELVANYLEAASIMGAFWVIYKKFKQKDIVGQDSE